MPTTRRIRPFAPGGGERKVTWLELFYDLVYVATVIELGNLLARDTSPIGAAAFVGIFVAVWWAWTGMTFLVNRFLVDDPLHRVLLVVQMFALSIVAVVVGTAREDGGVWLVASYGVVRAILVLLYVRVHWALPDFRPLTRRYAVGFGVAVAAWFGSLALPADVRPIAWLVALALEFAVPLSRGSRRLGRRFPLDVEHLTERYGLFTIIVLGESFIKVVGALAQQPPHVGSLALAASGFAVAAAVWWTYVERAHATAARVGVRARYIWIYAHLALALGVTAMGVGLKKLVVIPFGEPAGDAARATFSIAIAVAFGALWLLERSLERSDLRVSWAFLGAAALVLATVPLAGSWPVLAYTVVVAAIVAVAVALVERSHPHP